MQPGGGGPMMLLGIEDVRKELKLTDEQTKKLDEFRKKQQEMFSGMRDLSAEERRKKMQEMQSKMQEMNKEVTAMLTPEQSKRLKQLQLQAGSVMQALNNEEVKKELNLTSEQTDKIKAIADDMRAQMNELRQGGGGDRQEMAKKSEELRKSTETKVMGVLTDEQKAKWKELMGEPFKGNLRPQMGRRPGGVIG
jgi:Spy/CpxP family protein refolding chaperone